METMTPDAPARRRANEVMCCGFCGGAPMHADPEASHRRCPGPDFCMCAADDHQPTRRVLTYQAKYSYADPEMVDVVAEGWTWLAEMARENAEEIARSTAKSVRRRQAAAPKVDKKPAPVRRMSPSSNKPGGNPSQNGQTRTLNPVEQLVEQARELDDMPARVTPRPQGGGAKL